MLQIVNSYFVQLMVSFKAFDENLYVASVMDWIVMVDQPFTAPESPWFRQIIRVCNPEAPLISDDMIRAWLLKELEECVQVAKPLLHVSISFACTCATIILISSNNCQQQIRRFAMTTDVWTSPNNRFAFIAITAHYIDILTDCVVLQHTLLNFIQIEGSHKGENLANYIVTSLKEWGLLDQVSLTIGPFVCIAVLLP